MKVTPARLASLIFNMKNTWKISWIILDLPRGVKKNTNVL